MSHSGSRNESSGRGSYAGEYVTFEGKATSRKVSLDVTVDGTEGAALGVMSQGELHSLALALFLPRVTLEASPFRFLVIDDPGSVHGPRPVPKLGPAGIDERTVPLEIKLKL